MAEKIHVGGSISSMGHAGAAPASTTPGIGTATPKGAATGANTGNKTGS